MQKKVTHHDSASDRKGKPEQHKETDHRKKVTDPKRRK